MDRKTNRRMEGQMDRHRWTKGWTDGQTHRRKDTWTAERQRDRQKGMYE